MSFLWNGPNIIYHAINCREQRIINIGIKWPANDIERLKQFYMTIDSCDEQNAYESELDSVSSSQSDQDIKDDKEEDEESNVGMIVGISIGGAAFIIFGILIICYFLR